MIDDIWSEVKVLSLKLLISKRGNRLERYGLPAVILSLLYFGPQISLVFFNSGSLLILSLLVIILSAWRSGYRTGLFSTFYSAGLTIVLFGSVYPLTSLTSHFFRLVLFIAEGILISTLIAAKKDAENKKDEFTALLSHELKNPLTVVKSYANLLKKQAAEAGNEKQLLYATKIEAHTNKTADLINDLLDITKITSGKLIFTDEHFDLDSLVKDTVNDQRLFIKSHKLIVKGKSTRLVWGDRYRLGQVITNLLTNAIKYSPGKDRVEISIRDTTRATIIKVKDYGMGIRKEESQRIFERFYRGASGPNKIPGLGMGLYISFQIVTRHRGNIWFKSLPKHGCSFYVKLPSLPARKISLG